MRALDMAARVPWAMRPEALEQLLQFAARAHDPDYLAAAERLSERAEEIRPQAITVHDGTPLDGARDVVMRGTIAVVPIEGPIFRYANLFSAISGATSLEQVASDFKLAVDSPDVSAIVLHVDSPGGEVNGTAEFAQAVYDARQSKPVVAYISHEGCSAAYWIASAADTVVVSPTAIVGSIGCIASVVDPRAEIDDGKYPFVSSQSPLKRPDPYTAQGHADMQGFVDDMAEQFISAVATYRGISADTVSADFGQGSVFVGPKSVAAGLADEVGTFEEVLAGLDPNAPDDMEPQDDGDGNEPPEPPSEVRRDRSGTRGQADHQVEAEAIPPHTSPKIAGKDAPWDGPAEVAKCPADEAPLRRMHAWVDAEGNPDAKSSYKLPHHRADGTMVPRGVYAAANRLPNTDIPDGDRAGVRAHLGKHYRELGETPPWENDGSGSSGASHDQQPGAERRPFTRSRTKHMSLKDRLLAVIGQMPEEALDGDEPPEEAVADRPSVTADRHSTQYEAAIEELRQQNARLQAENEKVVAEAIHREAVAFADRIIKVESRAFPSERDAIIRDFMQASTDDRVLGASRYEVDGKTVTKTRVSQLEERYAVRHPHALTTDQLVAGLHQVVVNQSETARTNTDAPADAAKLEELIGATPLGRETMRALRTARNGKGA